MSLIGELLTSREFGVYCLIGFAFNFEQYRLLETGAVGVRIAGEASVSSKLVQ